MRRSTRSKGAGGLAAGFNSARDSPRATCRSRVLRRGRGPHNSPKAAKHSAPRQASRAGATIGDELIGVERQIEVWNETAVMRVGRVPFKACDVRLGLAICALKVLVCIFVLRSPRLLRIHVRCRNRWAGGRREPYLDTENGYSRPCSLINHA